MRLVTPRNLAEGDLSKVPVVEVDRDGDIVTGFMIADNYFELYINGRLIGVDAIPFTPFNSHVVRFRVKRPYTIAVLAQDWKTSWASAWKSSQAIAGTPAMPVSWPNFPMAP